MTIQTPYLLFLADAKEVLSLKIAKGVVDWRPELCIGEIAMPDCAVTLGVPRLTLAEAKEQGAKTLVIGMTRSTARELGPFGITVNAILPGATETEVSRIPEVMVRVDEPTSKAACGLLAQVSYRGAVE